MTPRASATAGFSLIEVIVALLVLTIGLLGMAAGTGWIVRTVHYGELESARSTALRSAMELVRSGPYDDMEDGSDTFGEYTVSWTVRPGNAQSRPVEFVIVGPGREAGSGGAMPSISDAVADTVEYRILRRE